MPLPSSSLHGVIRSDGLCHLHRGAETKRQLLNLEAAHDTTTLKPSAPSPTSVVWRRRWSAIAARSRQLGCALTPSYSRLLTRKAHPPLRPRRGVSVQVHMGHTFRRGRVRYWRPRSPRAIEESPPLYPHLLPIANWSAKLGRTAAVARRPRRVLDMCHVQPDQADTAHLEVRTGRLERLASRTSTVSCVSAPGGDSI